MRSTFVCVLTLLICHLTFELGRRDRARSEPHTACDEPVDRRIGANDHGERRFICARHLYPSYLGTAEVNAHCWDPPLHDRHLYPSYLGHAPGGSGRLLRGNDLPVMPCTNGMFPDYIPNTREWNACRRALGLAVPADADPDPACTGDRTPYRTRTRTERDADGCYRTPPSPCDPESPLRYLGGNPNPACVRVAD